MSEMHNYENQLAAVMEEIKDLETQRLKTFAEIGEQVFPELCDKPEYAELASEIGRITDKAKNLKQQEAILLEEKERFEKAEKERIARFTCVACKTVNPETARFCEECGAPVGVLPREYCKSCSTMNYAGLKFCGECGTKLDEAAAQ